MVKETSISDKDLNSLTDLAKRIKEKYGVILWFAEIFGKRWSYLAGEKDISEYVWERIQINDKLGILVNDWGNVSEEIKKEILDLIRENIREMKG